MSPSPSDFRVSVLLSFQRALWDLVTPPLRAVAVMPDYPIIRARLIYEFLGEVERELAAEVETYVLADFNGPVDTSFRVLWQGMQVSRDLEAGEDWVYRRWEQNGEL